MNFIILLFIILIVASLGSALIAILKGGDAHSDRLFKSLVVRIILSLTLFILLMIATYMGWITPHSPMVDLPPQQ